MRFYNLSNGNALICNTDWLKVSYLRLFLSDDTLHNLGVKLVLNSTIAASRVQIWPVKCI